MKTEPNDPINVIVEEVEHGMTGSTMDATHYGLTKREYFAGLAMQGLLTNYVANEHYGNHKSFPMVEEMAVSCADRLIQELNLKTP